MSRSVSSLSLSLKHIFSRLQIIFILSFQYPLQFFNILFKQWIPKVHAVVFFFWFHQCQRERKITSQLPLTTPLVHPLLSYVTGPASSGTVVPSGGHMTPVVPSCLLGYPTAFLPHFDVVCKKVGGHPQGARGSPVYWKSVSIQSVIALPSLLVPSDTE